MNHFKMAWKFSAAENGNIALTGEIDLQAGDEFTLAISLGYSYQSAAANLLQSLATPFDFHHAAYVRQWQRTVVNPKFDFSTETSDDGRTYHLSRCVLLAQEDKIFQGALAASMSTPWGETKGDNDIGGYHLVWTRDLVQSATALLASGETDAPVRALIWTAFQRPDGSFPQNSCPTNAEVPDPHADPNTTMISIANGGGLNPGRNIIGCDFLHLVRLGIRDANDPIAHASIEVIDRVIKRNLPQGPCWRRYNHDGYGQKDDGSMKRGRPTGVAMPLCWSHAEYVTLVRSRRERICFERVEPAFQRYVVNPIPSRHEIWSFRHQLRQMPHQKILRIIVAAEATIVWSANHWATANKSDTMNRTGLNLWFADLATKDLPDGSVVEFTFFWKDTQRWEGRNWQIDIEQR